MWTEPKTDWAAEDAFTLADYDRLRGNIAEVWVLMRRLNAIGAMPVMRGYGIEELPGLDFFMVIEENLRQLCKAGLDRVSYRTQQLAENGPIWDWRDLNRLETMLVQLRHDLLTQQTGRQTLAYRMGGGMVGGYL